MNSEIPSTPPVRNTGLRNTGLKNAGLRLARFLATGFYSGLSPKMPGTIGSITAFVLLLLLFQLLPELASTGSMLTITAFTFFLGVYCANAVCRAERELKQSDTRHSDPQYIVIDEFAGYFTAVIGLGSDFKALLLALVFFRLFDITKLPPIKRLEKFPDGWGIMLDDILAGIYAAVATRVVLSLL